MEQRKLAVLTSPVTPYDAKSPAAVETNYDVDAFRLTLKKRLAR